MKEDINKYIFQKKYDNFYLFTEFDIIFNEEFTEKLNTFYEKTKGENLCIEIEVPFLLTRYFYKKAFHLWNCLQK